MSPEVLDYLHAYVVPKKFNPGELIYNQGDISDKLIYLEDGLVLTYTILPDGREKNIALCWGGQTVGLSTFLEDIPHRDYAIAIQKCSVLAVPREQMEDCIAHVPAAKDDLIRCLASDVQLMFDKIADSALSNTELRVARFISRRVMKSQFQSRGRFPVLNFTQDAIADIVGISRGSVSEALSDFAKRGWVSIGYGSITVLAPEEIYRFAYTEESV